MKPTQYPYKGLKHTRGAQMRIENPHIYTDYVELERTRKRRGKSSPAKLLVISSMSILSTLPDVMSATRPMFSRRHWSSLIEMTSTVTPDMAAKLPTPSYLENGKRRYVWSTHRDKQREKLSSPFAHKCGSFRADRNRNASLVKFLQNCRYEASDTFLP